MSVETGLERPVSQRSLSVTRNSSFKGLKLNVGGLFSRVVSAISGLSGKNAELISQYLFLCMALFNPEVTSYQVLHEETIFTSQHMSWEE